MKDKHVIRKQNVRLFVRGFLVFLFLIITFALAYKYLEIGKIENNPKLAELEKSLQEIRASMNIDSIRQYNIQKVMKIIGRYNKTMPSGVKYSIAEEIYELSTKYNNLDVDLICATITFESGGTWEPEIVSDAGAIGLMQILPATSIWVAYYEGITWTSAEDVLYNPIYNIRLGCRELSTFIDYYGLKGGLAAFCGGEKQAAVWVANDKSDEILMAETTDFIPQVLVLYNEFKTFSM